MAALAVLCLALSWSLGLHAQPSATKPRDAAAAKAKPEGPAWSSLTAAQRGALAPLQRDWDSIDARRKAKWLAIADRFPKMPADERERVHARMTEWAKLTPAERGRARQSFQESKRLSPTERQSSWEAYQALPDTERKALAARASAAQSKPAGAAPLSMTLDAARQGPATLVPLTPPVSPTVVQGNPGATTRSIAKPTAPPAHQQAGQPRIAAKPEQVDSATLLPRRAAAERAKTGSTSASNPRP